MNISEINPYTYRGYRYDVEINMYYLNSRYYSPVTGRFINGDGLLGSTGNTLGHNMFAYTQNNPVILTDSTGFRPVRGVTGDDSNEYRAFDDILDLGIPDYLNHNDYCSIKKCYEDYYNSKRDYYVRWGSFAVGLGIASEMAVLWFAGNPEPITKLVGSFLIMVVGTAVIGSITYAFANSLVPTAEEKLLKCVNKVLKRGDL